MAEQFDLMFFECSCKTGVNINDAFQELVEKMKTIKQTITILNILRTNIAH